MSWWMRRRGRASARAASAVSGSVSSMLPPTIQNVSTSPAALAAIASVAVHPGVSGGVKPHTAAKRARVSVA